MKLEERAERLSTIKTILREERIGEQNMLLKILRRSGFDITQATLSRDLKHLNVSKRPDGQGGYVYTIPSDLAEQIAKSDVDQTMRGFLGIEFSGNLGFIKTLPGYASSIASGLDKLAAAEILGTIAGDDSILVVPRDGVSRQDLIKALIARIPGIKERMG